MSLPQGGPGVPSKKQWRILTVDDEAGVRNLIKDVLEPQFTVHVAVDGPDALEQVKRVNPHLILLDLKMPGMDGLAVLAKLKSNPETSTIPVVIVSAKGDTDSLIEGQHAGAVDHLIKPFGVDQLRVVVQRQFSLRGD